MSRILFTIILFSLSFSVFAKSDLSKKEKAIVKSLKKQYKLESVEIERPYNDFVYYELLTKDFKRMIADSTGTVIIPQSRQISDAYQNRIRLIRGHERGLGNFRERGRNARTITAYYPDVRGTGERHFSLTRDSAPIPEQTVLGRSTLST